MLDIKSLRQTINEDYIKPDVELVEKYKKQLLDSPKAQEYLTGRGLSEDTIKHFQLGYSSDYDAISIPTYKDKQLVNIKYRLLDPKGAKYLGEKGAETWVFNDEGLEAAKKKGKVLVVEGEFDCMMAHQSGIDNVISPASGKDSYGVWLERLDKIPKVYIAYDNDKGGKASALDMSTRVGTEKSFDVQYPTGIKDANEYLLSHTSGEFRELINSARPYISHKFKGLGDIIESLRADKEDTIRIPFIPKVDIEKDWLIIISGKSNVGKTSYILNITDFLAGKQIPVLVMPFERGIESVGHRFLQVMFEKTKQQLKDSTSDEWRGMIDKCVDSPVYFALPQKADIVDTIVTSRRLFGTRVVIIDHLDYIVRHTTGSKEAEIGQTLQELKRVAEENKVILLIVTHIRKIDHGGKLLSKKPGIEDLKGSSSLYQDPECVVMLDGDGQQSITVDVVKNKGEMSSQMFPFIEATGKLEDAWGGMWDGDE